MVQQVLAGQAASNLAQGFNDTSSAVTNALAMAALRKQYGDVAGDPTRAAQLQTNAFNEVNNPLVLAHNKAVNEGLVQTNAFNAANNPNLVRGNEAIADTNALMAQQAKQTAVQNNQRAVLGTVLDTAAPLLQGVTDPAKRAAIFNKVVRQAAPLVGMTPDQAQQQVTGVTTQIQQGGADTIPGIKQMLSQSRTAALTPAQRQAIQLQKAKAATEAARQADYYASAQSRLSSAASDRADTSVKTNKDRIANQQSIAAIKDKLTGIATQAAGVSELGDGVDRKTGAVIPGRLSNAIEAAQELSRIPAQNWGSAKVPGTAANKYEQSIASVSSVLRLFKLIQIKNGGGTFGNMTEKEFTSLSDSVANLSVNRDPEELVRVLEQLKNKTVPGFMDALQKNYNASAGSLRQLSDVPGATQNVDLSYLVGSSPNRIPVINSDNRTMPLPPEQQQSAVPNGSYAAKTAQAESGGDPNAKVPASVGTAAGLYGFTQPTWSQTRQRHPGANLPKTVAEATPEQQRLALRFHTQNNAKVLGKAGVPASATNLRLAHHYGAGGALRILRAPTNTPMAAILSKKVMRDNAIKPGTTTGDVIEHATQLMQGAGDREQKTGQSNQPALGDKAVTKQQMRDKLVELGVLGG